MACKTGMDLSARSYRWPESTEDVNTRTQWQRYFQLPCWNLSAVQVSIWFFLFPSVQSFSTKEWMHLILARAVQTNSGSNVTKSGCKSLNLEYKDEFLCEERDNRNIFLKTYPSHLTSVGGFRSTDSRLVSYLSTIQVALMRPCCVGMTQIWTFHCGVNSSWDLTFSDQIEATSRWDPTHGAGWNLQLQHATQTLRPTCFSVLTLVLSIQKSMFRTRWKRKTNGGICGCDTLRFVPLQKQYFNICFRHVYTDFLYLYYVVFVYALGLVLGCHYFSLDFKEDTTHSFTCTQSSSEGMTFYSVLFSPQLNMTSICSNHCQSSTLSLLTGYASPVKTLARKNFPPFFSNSACVPFVPLFLAADMETAPSSTRSEWATTIPWSRRSTRRSTPWIRSSPTRAITPTATTTTWPWCACRREWWATRPGSACRSVVTFSPPVCPWRGRGCSNRPATVTSPAGVTQVRTVGAWRGAGCGSVLVKHRSKFNLDTQYWLILFLKKGQENL